MAKFGFRKLETHLYGTVRKYVDILNRLRVTHESVGRTDRQIDGQTDRHSGSKCRASLQCAAKHRRSNKRCKYRREKNKRAGLQPVPNWSSQRPLKSL